MIPRASDVVRDEWARRVVAEYTSSAVTQELGLWLTRLGASPDLVKKSLRIARDELEHARLARRVLAAAGGNPDRVAVDQRALGLARHDDALEVDVTRAAVSVFCLGETVAVRLFAALRAECTVPVARAALDRVLRDEVRHRDFGWLLLEWLVSSPWSRAVFDVCARELPAMVEALEASYAPPANLTDPRPIRGAERAWGLMPAARYAAVLRRAITHDCRRRFAALGVDTQHAFTRLG